MFDKPTRTAIKNNTNNFGDGLAGRGLGLNNTIHELRPLVTAAVPALRNLATSGHRIARACSSPRPRRRADGPGCRTERRAVQRPRHLLQGLRERDASSLEAANGGGPASLKQATYSLPHEAPFYEDATEFMHLLRPSASSLRTVAPQLGHAFSVGAVNLAAATALNTRLAETSQALQEFAQNPVVSLASRRLHANP